MRGSVRVPCNSENSSRTDYFDKRMGLDDDGIGRTRPLGKIESTCGCCWHRRSVSLFISSSETDGEKLVLFLDEKN